MKKKKENIYLEKCNCVYGEKIRNIFENSKTKLQHPVTCEYYIELGKYMEKEHDLNFWEQIEMVVSLKKTLTSDTGMISKHEFETVYS